MARSLEDVGCWFDQQVGAWLSVDPETFTAACIELEVWEFWEACDALDRLEDYFEDDAVAATMRFIHVACAIHDGTLSEFVIHDDEGSLVIPHAVFWAAATAPFDTETLEMNDPAYRAAIAAELGGIEIED